MTNRRMPLVLVAGIVVAALFASACGRSEVNRTVFAVEGMHCDACSSAITASVEKIEGVVEVSADHEMGVADVTYDSQLLEAEALRTEIESLGFSVVVMETQEV